jgi:hypothetical protein
MTRKLLTTAIIVLLLGLFGISRWGTGAVQAGSLGDGAQLAAAGAECSKLKLSRPAASISNGRPRITFNISNQGSGTYVQNIAFDWEAYRALQPGQLLQRWRYDGAVIYNTAEINTSPYTWKKPNTDLLQGELDTFSFEFTAPDAGWPGNIPATTFGLEVQLGNGCVVAFHPGTQQQTPTATPTVTATPTITATPSAPPAGTVTPTRTPTACFDC